MRKILLSCAVVFAAITSVQAQAPANAIEGKFSVAADKQVFFAKGNLRYTQSTQTWAFAEHQYDVLGMANISDYELADEIDLFGWSGSTGSAKWGVSTSKDYNDYSGDFADWGKNPIGTDTPNTWRTLSKEEWNYIFYTRTNAAKLFGLGSVNGVNGTIILPDNWTTPADVTFTPSTEKGLKDKHGSYYNNPNGDNYTHNIYTLSDWQKMEEAGAVFLPAAGRIFEQEVGLVQECGGYWSSTSDARSSAYDLYFLDYRLLPQYDFRRSYGLSVRLVTDYSGTVTGISNIPSAGKDENVRKVFRNGQVLILRNGKIYTLTGAKVK